MMQVLRLADCNKATMPYLNYFVRKSDHAIEESLKDPAFDSSFDIVGDDPFNSVGDLIGKAWQHRK